MQIRKNKRAAAEKTPATKQTAEEGLAWAAGSEQFQHRDPLYHVTESFQQTFDRIGRSHARELIGGFTAEEREEEGQAGKAEENREPRQERRGERTERDTRMLRRGNAPEALTRFSDVAFQRGAMSASVLNGTGKMMLVSCLKRTAGENDPRRIQQTDVLQTGSQVRNIPGRSPDQMVFNRSFAKSALGIVVDTVRDARRVVDSMTEMALGTGELQGQDSAAMRTMYPFLDTSRDRALEAEYREKLARCDDPREKPILQNALAQVLSLQAKKAQMRNEFMNKLRFIADRATETLAELEAPGTLEEIQTSVWGGREPELPENPEEGTGSDAPDGSKNRGGAANLSGQGTDEAAAGTGEPDGGRPGSGGDP